MNDFATIQLDPYCLAIFNDDARNKYILSYRQIIPVARFMEKACDNGRAASIQLCKLVVTHSFLFIGIEIKIAGDSKFSRSFEKGLTYG